MNLLTPLHIYIYFKAEVFAGFQLANMLNTKSLYDAGQLDDHTGCVVGYLDE
jgi:hypothetical protein